MPEILLHYIWQKGLFAGFRQETNDGRQVEVLYSGDHNTDAGPDFTNVRLRIDGQEFAGNVEIHVRASDWNRHHHDADPAYDNILLHIVRDNDTEVRNSKGDIVPQCRLQYADNQDYLAQLTKDAAHIDSIAWHIECSRNLLQDPALMTLGWRNALLHKRLECKKEAIAQLLDITHNNREQAFYITLAHHFGFHTNSLPFEQLAIQTPLSCLQKHRNSLFQLTALLLGQSGLLDSSKSPDRELLQKEYSFLRKKFSLTPVEAVLWKRLRMRPAGMPETRIRQFAQLIYQSEFLFSKLMETTDTDALVRLLKLRELTEDEQHNVAAPPKIGLDSIHLLLINTVVPYLYTRGKEKEAVRLLEELPAENNSIIRQWRELGQSVRSAADSQALLHLYQHFCQPSKCLNCDIAYRIFMAENRHFINQK